MLWVCGDVIEYIVEHDEGRFCSEMGTAFRCVGEQVNGKSEISFPKMLSYKMASGILCIRFLVFLSLEN